MSAEALWEWLHEVFAGKRTWYLRRFADAGTAELSRGHNFNNGMHAEFSATTGGSVCFGSFKGWLASDKPLELFRGLSDRHANDGSDNEALRVAFQRAREAWNGE